MGSDRERATHATATSTGFDLLASRARVDLASRRGRLDRIETAGADERLSRYRRHHGSHTERAHDNGATDNQGAGASCLGLPSSGVSIEIPVQDLYMKQARCTIAGMSTTITLPSGHKLRSASKSRFLLVSDSETHGAHTVRRSASIEVLRKVKSRIGYTPGRTLLLVDSVTKEVIK